MVNIAEAFVTLRPDATNFGAEVEKQVSSALGRAGKIGLAAAGAAAAAAGGLEALTRSQQDATRAVAALSAQLGLQEETVRQLATSLSNVDTPLHETLGVLQEAARQGIRGEAALAQFAQSWDLVADATNVAGDALAKQGNVLQSVGIDTNHLADAMDAFGFVQTNTTEGVQGLLDLLARRGSTIREFGLQLNDVAALLAVMQRELGLTGRALFSEFDRALTESNGDLNGVLSTLGVSQETFDRYRTAVTGSASSLDQLAAANVKAFTPLQKLQQQLDELVFSNSKFIEQSASVATILSGGIATTSAAAGAYRGLAAAAAASNIAISATPVGLALTAAALVAGSVLWSKYAEGVDNSNRALAVHSEAARLAAETSRAAIEQQLAESEALVESLRSQTQAIEDEAIAVDENGVAHTRVLGPLKEHRDALKAAEDRAQSAREALSDLDKQLRSEAAVKAKAATDNYAASLRSLSADALAAQFALSNLNEGFTTEEDFAARLDAQAAALRRALDQQVRAKAAASALLNAADPGEVLRNQLNATTTAAGSTASGLDATAAAARRLAEESARAGEALGNLDSRGRAMLFAQDLVARGFTTVEAALANVHPAALSLIRDLKLSEEETQKIADALLGVTDKIGKATTGIAGGFGGFVQAREKFLELERVQAESNTRTATASSTGTVPVQNITFESITVGAGATTADVQKVSAQIVEATRRGSLAGR